MVKMSVWPETSTPCCAQTFSVVTAWTASTSPAWTEVMAWGDLMEWKIWRASRGGTAPRALDEPA